VRIEQEPGSGGIAQVHAIVRNLQGWSVEGVKATGSKEVRADPVASQVNVGNVKILAGNWNEVMESDYMDRQTNQSIIAGTCGYGFQHSTS